MIRGKYGEDRGDWCSQEVREAHGVGALERCKDGLGFGGSQDFIPCR